MVWAVGLAGARSMRALDLVVSDAEVARDFGKDDEKAFCFIFD